MARKILQRTDGQTILEFDPEWKELGFVAVNENGLLLIGQAATDIADNEVAYAGGVLIRTDIEDEEVSRAGGQ
jgi:hypothetical protein